MTNKPVNDAFEEWLDGDASETLMARSKFYSAQSQVLASLAWDAASKEVEAILREKSIELHDLKCALREVFAEIEGNKCDLSQGGSAHEVHHNAILQRCMDIINKQCGTFL